ncbi:putative uncharacterized protein C3orf49 homolog isoform X2 [Bombina bombina]|uniref:putative uncharacterized protein C3orf49 homolog isoform X2 n=1 Tax=Bombina bombina TaxID=8345 RepID=UPI00235A6E03|nr:putative uncharacterized protein C3orf49 homolog isoform X2 [Bombina bombina]
MSEQQKFQTGRPKGKGIVRWHGAVSTNLANQHVLIPKEESSSESDSESFIVSEKKRKGFTHKVRAAFGKVLPPRQREDNGIKLLGNLRNDFPERQTRIPKIIQHLSLPREILKKPESRRSQAEAETERITANNVLVRSKKLTRRVSVTSVPSGLQKGPYSAKKRHFAFNKKKKKTGDKVRFQSGYTVENLQMQVDDLIETIADKSTKLLAQRHAELQQCESLGDEILQSSKQFQRVSKKNTRKYQFKNVCFPCLCCY